MRWIVAAMAMALVVQGCDLPPTQKTVSVSERERQFEVYNAESAREREAERIENDARRTRDDIRRARESMPAGYKFNTDGHGYGYSLDTDALPIYHGIAEQTLGCMGADTLMRIKYELNGQPLRVETLDYNRQLHCFAIPKNLRS